MGIDDGVVRRLDKVTTPTIGCYLVLMTICILGCLGVVGGLGRESGDLDAINIGDCS